jgi:thioredoxin-like negative regulator of GroEL
MKILLPTVLICAFLALMSLRAETPTSRTPYAEAMQAFESGDQETARMLLEAVLAQDPHHQAARLYLKRISTKASAGSALQQQLKQIILPSVDLEDVAPRDAFTFLSQQVETLTEGKRHLNIVWLAPPKAGNRITLALQNVPISEVLQYLATMANLRIAYDRDAVKVLPAVSATPQ